MALRRAGVLELPDFAACFFDYVTAAGRPLAGNRYFFLWIDTAAAYSRLPHNASTLKAF